MAYLLTLNDKEHRAEVQRTADGIYTITLDGETHHVDAAHTIGHLHSILMNGAHYEADIDLAGNESVVRVQGATFNVHVIDERRKHLEEVAPVHSVRRGDIHAPMPGKIVRLLVKAGDTVEAGQGIIVVEAMKMENQLLAPRAGVVKSILIQAGDTVDAHKLLAVIE